MRITEDWVNVSHGVGVPFGAIGTGYGVLGRYGFVMPNFNSFPCQGKYKNFQLIEHYDYLDLHEKDRKNFLDLSVDVYGKRHHFQQELLGQEDDVPADSVISHEFLPFSLHKAHYTESNFSVEILALTPLIPHDLKESTIPALGMEISIINNSNDAAQYTLKWNIPEQTDNLAVAFDNDNLTVTLNVDDKSRKTVRGFFAWYYPSFTTPSPMLPEPYTRYYTLHFGNAREVIKYAQEHYDNWKQRITAWHDSLCVPSPFRRMWFSSLSSVITSTMMSTEPRFFEIETPHAWVNTHDVNVYSGWIYMINWPEIEKLDMLQYMSAIPREGEDKGLVWHSLWTDRCDYVSEPCFITRVYRDYLWFNDKTFLNDALEPIEMAFQRVYRQSGHEGLLESAHGNQSYDVWKMPGISAYVNMPWMYALYAINKINKTMGCDIRYEKQTAREILKTASESFVRYLWNKDKSYFNCFYRTEGARDVSIPESVFTDHMFGRWLMLIEKDLDPIIPVDMIRKSLLYVYKNNLIDDPENNFRGWANGKLPDGVPCYDNRQYHVKTCWMGAQLNLSSLLGELGYEEQMLDVFYSLENSLGNNHLAVGEWNKSITPEGLSCPLPEEISKDTPRFPAYPRYKSCWELLVRILGLTMNETFMELKPIKSFSFEVKDVKLAGCILHVITDSDWNEIIVDGKKQDRAIFDRNASHMIFFVKR